MKKQESIGEWFPIDQLKEWRLNPRKNDHAVERVEKSIRRFGFGAPIVANRETKIVIAGHTRLKAVRRIEGMTHVPVRFLDLSPEESEKLALADNKLGEIADWDNFALADLLEQLDREEALDLGWNEGELDELLKDSLDLAPDPEEEISDLDNIPVDVEPITSEGEVIDIGGHRLYCMDNIDVLRAMEDNSIDSIVTDPPYGIDFMSSSTGWDKSVPGGEWASECLRVLKPGGHLISFGSTRTFHRLVTNIENAGFEIRDTINWLYFSGFPKSLNISMAVDGTMINKKSDSKSLKDINENSRTGKGRLIKKNFKNGILSTVETGPRIKRDEPATKEAKEADGIGTALKPAFEPATLCRKPLSEKTVALNWLKWKTGGLNIDDCRFGYGDPCWVGPNERDNYRSPHENKSIQAMNRDVQFNTSKQVIANWSHRGRWPANIYQCPKASRGEREEGCEDMEKTKGFDAVNRKEGSAGVENPRAGAGRTASEVSNIHPTVKPVKLMRWLVRLVTPPGGTVLDTFVGSGTTMIAAELEGIKSIGIEREPKYCDIIRARLSAAIEEE